MRFDIVDSLLDWQEKKSHWPSSPVINHDGVVVALSDAVGKQAKTPDHTPNQPYIHPKKSTYQFDPKRFSGPDAHSDLTELLKSSCPGCKLYGQKKDSAGHSYQLRCNHYPTVHQSSVKFFDEQCFTKDNCLPITNKGSSSKPQGAFSRMANAKLRSKPVAREAVDHRSSDCSQSQRNKRVQCNRAADAQTRCKMNIKYFMNPIDETWHLHTGSDLQHSYHFPEDAKASTLNKDDLSDDNLKALRIMFCNGVNPSVIAKVMTDIVHMETDKRGEFLTSSIYNIINSEQETMDRLAGIEADWSSAQKLLKKLDL